MIRGQNPMVLFPNLPRLLEAVVKSLDPSSSADREAVLDAATEILGQVVRTCVPSIKLSRVKTDFGTFASDSPPSTSIRSHNVWQSGPARAR